MEPIGFLGILKLATHIVCKNPKHFLCIATLWAIPYAFHLPVLDVSSFFLHSLVRSLFSLYRQLTASKQLYPPSTPPSHGPDPPFPTLHLASLFPFIARLFLSITISLISHPLLAFSVCRACLNKSLSLRGSLLGALRSAKSLALTSLCISAMVFGFVSMTIGIEAIILVVVAVVMGDEPGTVNITLYRMMLAMQALGGLYMGISFSLAQTVAMLEVKARGWGAMKRSMDLVRGRRWMALGLVCVFDGLVQPCEFGKLWQWMGARMVRVSLQAIIALFGMAAHIVLYVSCRRHKEEPVTVVVAARAEFGPQESSPKSPSQYMDVEATALLPPALPN